ncbi:tetratricopeptide repeat protein [uncultured Erythrobacter sp.]|uniref:tetratricopeptide repeat protein n=1 Tax=uncultured Erythrobacter sp. TaxID=263913 RepID=UPI002620C7C5|nr:tetratricopeptide repeat protein [uncultured Erythrobacter sp.]
MIHYRIPVFGIALASLGIVALPTSALAQNSTSRPVVQPLPSPEVERLNTALKKLARRPRDLDALIEAGNASLRLDDLDAAIGFFGRAEELSSENPRVKMGQAAVYLRSGRPIEALRLFAEAEAAGASSRDVLADRGLAYDLVGDQTRAQATYRQALREDSGNSLATRRLALSQAIMGEQRAFEETLRPLIDRREFAAFRARAFGLAILGEQDRAAAITDAVMPRDLAARITPYLEFMPRLTKAQQAAAANLGIFPRAADIGRDDPRIANFAAASTGATSASANLEAGNRLEPAGQPLGEPTAILGSTAPETLTQEEAAAELAAAPPTQTISETPSVSAQPPSTTTVAVADTSPQPGFDLARVAGTGSPSSTESAAVVRTGPVQTTTASAPPAAQPNFADAFGDLGTGDLPDAKTGSDAVNIASIEVPREAQVAPEPAEPVHPRRIWVQVATGRDRSALRFDWRRITRKASRLLRDYDPHVVAWGQSNRLLAGPVESTGEARRLVNALGEMGIDTFSYTSPEGTEIQELK